MKQLLYTVIIACFAAHTSYAASVSGTVRDAASGVVIPGQRVTVYDSLFTFTITVTTNGAGVYTASIPSATPNGTRIKLYTNACNYSATDAYNYAGTNVTINFNLCAGGTLGGNGYFLQGRFTSGGLAGNTGPAIVYLISKDYDPVLMDTTLTVVDSITPYYASVDFGKYYAAIPPGELYLKVALRPGHSAYASYPPAYHDSSLRWNTATPLTLRSFISDTTDVLMKPGINPGGPGFIGGSVLQGANKGSAVGDPLPNRIIILTTLAGQPVAFTRTAANGTFALSNLPYGTYLLFGDALGKENPALTVTISPAKDHLTDVIFEENDKHFNGSSASLAVPKQHLPEVSIAPNPFKDHIHIKGLTAISGSKRIMLRDVLGQLILEQSINEGDPGTIDASQVPAGSYLLQIVTSKGMCSFYIRTE